ncbi:hypothetical protein M3Y95_01201500 [Aphelenchoides besseyi]|nr:hypothetical protein M3Y95_01201500 [Aphelenchoides besseyi]
MNTKFLLVVVALFALAAFGNSVVVRDRRQILGGAQTRPGTGALGLNQPLGGGQNTGALGNNLPANQGSQLGQQAAGRARENAQRIGEQARENTQRVQQQARENAQALRPQAAGGLI